MYNRAAIRTRHVLAGVALMVATVTLGSPIAMAALAKGWPPVPSISVNPSSTVVWGKA